MRSKINYLTGFLISALVFPVLLVTGIQWTAYNEAFYERQYNRLNTAETIGISRGDLSRVTGVLVDYIRGKRDSLDVEAEIRGERRLVFNDRETAHMVDVRKLFNFAERLRKFSIFGILLLGTILYFNSGKHPLRFLASSYLAAGAVLLVLLAVLIPLVRSNFTYYWDQFHYLFFDNDLWLLNPETDIMIQMLPESFFNHAVQRVMVFFAGGSIILAIPAIFLHRQSRRQRRKNAGQEKPAYK